MTKTSNDRSRSLEAAVRWETVMLALVVVLMAAPAWADFKAGVEAYERGDYETALTEFRPLAQQGVASVQFGLGFIYHQGPRRAAG